MSARHPGTGLLLWLAALAAGLFVLHGAGGALAPPPLSQPGQVSAWLAERDPAEAALSVVRVLALAAGWYLMGVTLVGALARWLRAGRVVRASNLLTLPAVLRLLNRAVGLSMAAAAFSGSAALAAQPDSPPPPGAELMARLPDGAAASPPVTMRRLPDPPPGPAPGVMERLPDDDKPPTDAGPPTPTTWTVGPGDHFWSVAEKTLAAAWNRAPSDAETGPYWRDLVAANRPVLKDRDNPDLLFPGQVLTVPTPPSPPASPTRR
jgi:hypothetical protein